MTKAIENTHTDDDIILLYRFCYFFRLLLYCLFAG